MKYKEHKIFGIEPESIAEELEIERGDTLVWINEESIQDVFDYRYLIADESIDVCIRKANGEEWILEIDKEYGQDLGLVFENSLMDELIRCRNKCKFCFIDQLPPNMRQTVYFKDDDWRMSFLNGNYITLTNMSQKDIERLIKYRLSPLNVSIHATDEKVRMDLLSNRFAGRIMEQLKMLIDAGIEINGQIVLCKGLNDGKILDKTIEDLSQFIPHILSLTVVPVGVSKFREGLATLEGFDELAAKEVVEVIGKWQKFYLEKMGTRFVFAADEFYLTGKVPLLSYDEYEDFPVLDNGVGMITKFKQELENGLERAQSDETVFECSLVTGCITEEFMKESVRLIQDKFPNIIIHVYPVVNHFFGENITVTGLLTGQDIINTLQEGKPLGRVLFFAENMLKSGEPVLLDDYTVDNVSEALNIPIEIMPNDGEAWLENLITIKEKYK